MCKTAHLSLNRVTHTYPDCVNTEKAGRLAAPILDLPLLVVLLIGGRLCLIEPMLVSADFLASDVGNLKFKKSVKTDSSHF